MDKKTTLRGTFNKVLRTLGRERAFFKSGWLQSEASFLTCSQRRALRGKRYICRQKADKTFKVYVSQRGTVLAKNCATQSIDALRSELESLGYENAEGSFLSFDNASPTINTVFRDYW